MTVCVSWGGGTRFPKWDCLANCVCKQVWVLGSQLCTRTFIRIGWGFALQGMIWPPFSHVDHLHLLLYFLCLFDFQDWLVCHNPGSGCDSYFDADGNAYLDLSVPEVVDFLSGMSADLARNYYNLLGIMWDDHFEFPNEFGWVSYFCTTFGSWCITTYSHFYLSNK